MLEQILTPTIFAIFAIGFALIWDRNRNLEAAGFWALGYFCAFVGFTLTPLLNSFPQLEFLRAVGDTAYLVGALFLVVGFGRRYSIKLPSHALGIVFCSSLSVIYWHWFVVDVYSVRAEAISYGCGALLGIGAWMIYPTLKSHRNHTMFWILTAFAAQAFLVPIMSIHILNEDLAAAHIGDTLYLELMILMVSLISLCFAMALMFDQLMIIVRQLRDESNTDMLTGLLNRRAFEVEVSELRRDHEKHQNFAALIVCDIDHFKRINDTYGHGAGDKVIRGFGDILRRECRPEDIVGRIGGEEFAVLMPEANQVMARLMADKLRIAMEAYEFPVLENGIAPTVSFGITDFEISEEYEVAFYRADAALYTAKQDGRNCVRAMLESQNRKGQTKLTAAANLNTAPQKQKIGITIDTLL